MEDAVELAFEYAATGIKTELPEDFKVDIYSDFSLGLKASEDIQALIAMRKTVPPLISAETFLREVKRRGILSDNVDPEEEVGKTGIEPPPLSSISRDTEEDEITAKGAAE